MHRSTNYTFTLALGLSFFFVSGNSNYLHQDEPVRIAVIHSFDKPETAIYDASLDVFFVSNMVGNPTAEDNNGYISKIEVDSAFNTESFIVGGEDGVILHGPKGMVIQEDTLWVVDIDVLRGFDKRTGKLLDTIDLQPYGAIALNDITAHPDGSLYITDPRVVFDNDMSSRHVGNDRIFKITAQHEVTTAIEGDTLALPNGIEWDRTNQRLIIAPLNSTSIYAWHPGDLFPNAIGKCGSYYDGVEVLMDGSILVSCLGEGTVVRLENGECTQLIGNLRTPANFGFDAKHNYLAIPLVSDNRVEIWHISN